MIIYSEQLPRRKPRPTMWEQPFAVHTFARQLARRAVIARIRDLGCRLRDYSACDLAFLAGPWLMKHPELMAEARAICAQLHQRELQKRELARLRRQQARSANITSDAQRQQRCSDIIIPVQNIGAE
jgi:hypothetical protein